MRLCVTSRVTTWWPYLSSMSTSSNALHALETLPEDWRENPAPVVGRTSQNDHQLSGTIEYGGHAEGVGDQDGE